MSLVINHAPSKVDITKPVIRETDEKYQELDARISGVTSILGADALFEWCSGSGNANLVGKVIDARIADGSLEALMEALFLIDSSNCPLSKEKIDGIVKKISSYPLLRVIEMILEREGDKIGPVERKLMTHLKRQLPELNKTLVSYELLRKKTERMDVSQFRPQQIVIGKDSFDAYDTSGAEYRYIVHAAGLEEGPIEKTKQQRMRSGFLCTSIVSNKIPYFYEPQENYGMILSVDSRNIVATARQDAHTPYVTSDSKTLKYYCFYQRLQLLTAYVDRLYRESGVENGHTDPFSQLNRIRSMKDVQNVDAEMQELRERYPFLSDRDNTLFIDYTHRGGSVMKLEALDHFYKSQPDKGSPEQLVELERCKMLLKEWRSKASDFLAQSKLHIHPLQGSGEVLAQTSFQEITSQNSQGLRPYNEVNLDLRTVYKEGTDPIEVRAILIDQTEFGKYRSIFRNVLVDARANGIPILLSSLQILTPSEAQVAFRESVKSKQTNKIIHLLDIYPSLDDSDAGEALAALSCNGAREGTLSLINGRRPHIPKEYFKIAFAQALFKDSHESIRELLCLEFKGLKEDAMEALKEASDLSFMEIVDVLLRYNVPLSVEIIQKSFQTAVQKGVTKIAKYILSKERGLSEAFFKEMFLEAMALPTNQFILTEFVPNRLIGWAFREYLKGEQRLRAWCFIADEYRDLIANEDVQIVIKNTIDKADEKNLSMQFIHELIEFKRKESTINARLAFVHATSLGKHKVARQILDNYPEIQPQKKISSVDDEDKNDFRSFPFEFDSQDFAETPSRFSPSLGILGFWTFSAIKYPFQAVGSIADRIVNCCRKQIPPVKLAGKNL